MRAHSVRCLRANKSMADQINKWKFSFESHIHTTMSKKSGPTNRPTDRPNIQTIQWANNKYSSYDHSSIYERCSWCFVFYFISIFFCAYATALRLLGDRMLDATRTFAMWSLAYEQSAIGAREHRIHLSRFVLLCSSLLHPHSNEIFEHNLSG